MEYKVIQFKHFLKENKLKVIDLPEPIQEKIDIFYRLHELLETIQEPDLQELLEQVEQLDIEILEDIEEEYEDKLTNNEHSSSPEKIEVIKKTPPKKKVSTKAKSDEMILDELVKMKRTKGIKRSKLVAMGLKTRISGGETIGKHTLKRTSFFYYRFDIIPSN
ncbi:hypothetical protein [Aquimarina megaterium]|uniref:hypothetical protein n=1 Tax=Aquimarina megaterium TaxID=1443666 RepID=UPI000470D686|nr:hypothetical protein [Aquimarina megaterium]